MHVIDIHLKNLNELCKIVVTFKLILNHKTSTLIHKCGGFVIQNQTIELLRIISDRTPYLLAHWTLTLKALQQETEKLSALLTELGVREHEITPRLGCSSQGYDEAVLSLVFAAGHNKFLLLLAILELFPHEVPTPATTKQECLHELKGLKIGSTKFNYYARQIKMGAQEAVRWYEQLCSGVFLLYADTQKDDQPTMDQVVAENLPLVQEPLWPAMIITHEHSEVSSMPVLSPRWSSPKVHHLFNPEVRDQVQSWSESELSAFQLQVENALGMSLKEWPELIGSAHLIAPNPVFRSLAIGMRGEGTKQEELTFTLHLRERQSVEGLTLIVSEKRTAGDGFWTAVPCVEGTMTIALPYQVQEVMAVVTSEVYGVIHRSGPHSFLSRIEIGMHLITSHRKVETRDGPVQSGLSKPTTITVGEPLKFWDARHYLSKAQRERAKGRVQDQREQRWFSGDSTKARQELGQLVRTASRRLLIVDPYLSVQDAITMLSYSGNLSIQVEMLTSAMYLQNRDVNVDEQHDALESWNNHKQSCQAIEVRVMRGRQKAPIHDRFLVIDGDVWSLGCSINEFGSRGSLLLKVPEPELILSEIQKVYDESWQWEDWYASRKGAEDE